MGSPPFASLKFYLGPYVAIKLINLSRHIEKILKKLSHIIVVFVLKFDL